MIRVSISGESKILLISSNNQRESGECLVCPVVKEFFSRSKSGRVTNLTLCLYINPRVRMDEEEGTISSF
jgi:hypothetical protein